MVLVHHSTERRVDGEPPLFLHFRPKWELLGPFQIGTREASWGADPLEKLGGFHSLQCEPNSVYASSLGPSGLVKWTHCQCKVVQEQTDGVEIALNVTFPEIDWQWLQQVYGWAALQYQAWARGELMINGQVPQAILLYTDNILELWIDDQHYFGGDYYAYRQAPLVLHLGPGFHKVELRLVRDVRVMGSASTSMSITLKVERSKGSLAVLGKQLVISDIVNGTIASPYAALPVRNEGKQVVTILKVQSARGSSIVRMLDDTIPFRLAASQSRSIPLFIASFEGPDPEVNMEITYTNNEAPHTFLTTILTYYLTVRDLHEPHKVTFLHPSRLVSYAILRAPSKKSINAIGPARSLPILLNLHGAGLEADSDQVRHMLDPLPDLRAFVLFPTGVTPWSSDDWHDWGFADVRAAIASIINWVTQIRWDGPLPDGDRWLVSGHSNGGQGALYAATHHSDKIIGGAPVSGYLSIQKYVPYSSWNAAESRVTSMIQNALQSYKHELLVENLTGLPVLLQHGSEDGNVPVFHSRRLHQLISLKSERGASNSDYVEVQGKDHWYEGVMTTPPLKRFYEKCLAGEAKKPPLPQSFHIVVTNPADMTSRGGFQVDQLITPYQLGRIKIMCDDASASVLCETSNIRRFHLVMGNPLIRAFCRLVVDGQQISEFPTTSEEKERSHHRLYLCLINGVWKMSQCSQWRRTERCGRQLGPLQAILCTRDRFRIQYLAAGAADIALQISHNLYQYFRADAEIVEGGSDTNSLTGNLITVSLGIDDLPKPFSSCPVEIDGEGGVVVRTRGGSLTRRYGAQDGLGAIFLRPLANERLELVMWGLDQTGLRQAARLFPMLTGVGQPEFVVVKKSMGWLGAAGALAMGSFDSHWQVSEGSFLQ